LFVVAIDDDRVEMPAHELLDGGEWLSAVFDRKLKLAQDLRHRASSLFIGTEDESLITHTIFIVGTPVRAIKLRR